MKKVRMLQLVGLATVIALLAVACGQAEEAAAPAAEEAPAEEAAPAEEEAAPAEEEAAPAEEEAPAEEVVPSGEPIKFGFYAPITGPAAADGEAAVRGAELAAMLINEKGGVMGRPLELVTYDDAFSPDEAANVTRRLIEQDEVSVVVSGSYSFTTRAGAPIAQEAGVPFIAAYAVHPEVTTTGEYVWRIGALAPVQGKAAADLVVNEMGAQKIAMLVIDNDYGISLADAFKAYAEALGAEIAYEEKYPLGESDFRPLLGGIEAVDPDVLFVTGYYGEGASLVSQVAEAGMDVQVVGVEGFDSPTFIELAGDAANGVIFTSDLNRDSERPSVQEFLTRFQEEYDHPADMVAASCFDAVLVGAKAIEAAGSTEPDAIVGGLASLTNLEEAVTGPIIKFTAGREVLRPIGAQQVRDNEFHFYWETEEPDVVTPPQ